MSQTQTNNYYGEGNVSSCAATDQTQSSAERLAPIIPVVTSGGGGSAETLLLLRQCCNISVLMETLPYGGSTLAGTIALP